MDEIRPRLKPDVKKGYTVNHWEKLIDIARQYGPDEVLRQLGIISVSNAPRTTPAKILVFDIETAPLRTYAWRLWKTNLGGLQQSEWFMLTWSAKWLFDDKVIADKLTPEEVAREDDGRISKTIWRLFDEADIVIAHNAKKFDNKRLNTCFIRNGLPQPMPYQTIDTLIHARKALAFSSNKLDDIAQLFGLGKKIETRFSLWERCMAGEAEALEEMERYNIQDVKLLEDVYLILRPYIKPHPNIGLFIEDNVHSCPSCGSQNIEWGGTYATYANLFDAFRCKDCGSTGRSRKTKLSTDARRFLTLSTPH